MLRLFVGLIFTLALGSAGYMAGSWYGGHHTGQLLGLAGVFLAGMILVATRAQPL